MSAVRKLQYSSEAEWTSEVSATSVAPTYRKVAQPFYAMLATVILIIGLIAATSYVAFAVLQRHAEIDRLQFEIFNRQQAINKARVMVDELYVIRESYMTIEEIENFATNKLSMVKPSDQQKVVLRGDTYITLDESVAFKTIPTQNVAHSWWAEGLNMLSAKISFSK